MSQVAVRVFHRSRPDLNLPTPIIRSEENLLAFAMECVYTCEGSDQLANCYSILECLPERRPAKLPRRLKILHDHVDVLEKHLKVGRASLSAGEGGLLSLRLCQPLSSPFHVHPPPMRSYDLGAVRLRCLCCCVPSFSRWLRSWSSMT